MPIQNSILEHDVLGPVFGKGMHGAEMAILHRQSEKRFGTLPVWASDKLEALSASELEDLSVNLLDARSLEELRK
jgi:hypothetical protein